MPDGDQLLHAHFHFSVEVGRSLLGIGHVRELLESVTLLAQLADLEAKLALLKVGARLPVPGPDQTVRAGSAD